MSDAVTRSSGFETAGTASPGGGLAAAVAADGEMIDEFRLLEPLGRGGMGAVFRAHDTVLDREVALKLLARTRPGDHARVLIEARAVARLEHPNVVRIHRAVTDGERPYLVQELVRGRALDRLAHPLPPRRACELALGVARGLAAAHRVGILHRDVKPSNVMLTDDGAVKLLDFGIAKLTSDTADPGPGPGLAAGTPRLLSFELGLSVSGDIVGTPRYLAPELWRGDPATPRSDLYALGVMLYELVAGAPPFPLGDLDELALAVLRSPAAPPLVGDDVPLELSRLVARCLARAAGDRPHLDEVIAHLEAIVGDLPAPFEGNPYPGLDAFEAARRGDFCGRGGDVAAVLDRLRRDALVTITGDSGVGKSSLCRAGVLPAIAGGGLADGRTWRCAVMVPGRRPLESLRAALATRPSPHDGDDRGDGFALLIDQFEELVTAAADPAEAAETARRIAALADDPAGAVRIVVAVRGDLLTRVGELGELGPQVMRSIHLVRPLGAAALREAVIAPARLRGVRLASDAMVDELIAPVLADPSALPLLQFTLAALWETREDAVIPAEPLRRMGGVATAFAAHADGVIACLPGAARSRARQIVLACIDGRTLIGRDRDELCGDDPAAAAALEALVKGRILVARDQPGDISTYALVHEALIDGWPRLRSWLEERAGERALRSRLRIAADDWARAGRPAAWLWSRAAVRDTVRLDGLTGGEGRFVAASLAAGRRAGLRRAALIVAIPLAAAVAWFVVDARGRAARAEQVAAHRAGGRAHLATARALGAVAAVNRAAAVERFAAHDVSAGEARWAAAAEQAAGARQALGRGVAALESALLLAPTDGAVRADLAAVVHAQALLAEATGDTLGFLELRGRLERLDHGALAASLHQPAVLHVEVAGAVELTVRAVADHAGVRVGGAAVAQAGGPRLAATVAPGSFVIEARGADGTTAVLPVQLGRGEQLTAGFRLPARAELPAGFVFVPPGRFLTGARLDDFFRRDFLGADPEHAATTAGFLIARHEVTFGDWIAYLRALPPAEREVRRPRTVAGEGMAVRLEDEAPFALLLQPTPQATYRAREGEPIVFPGRDRRRQVRWENLPVSGISAGDAEAYAAWLAVSGKVPGARLCRELEWERAARGADGRAYPHGDRLAADDSNIDVTYGRGDDAFGPDEVGAHPVSDSPFGVSDMVGNVWEWVRGDDGTMLQRGGGWAHGASSALSANRDVNNPTMRYAWAGVRICADLEAASSPPPGAL